MENKEFIEKAKSLVKDYEMSRTCQLSRPPFEVFVVWNAYVLGNIKVLLGTTLYDGMYYEVTYNKTKNEIYLDAYCKVENRKVVL